MEARKRDKVAAGEASLLQEKTCATLKEVKNDLEGALREQETLQKALREAKREAEEALKRAEAEKQTLEKAQEEARYPNSSYAYMRIYPYMSINPCKYIHIYIYIYIHTCFLCPHILGDSVLVLYCVI